PSSASPTSARRKSCSIGSRRCCWTKGSASPSTISASCRRNDGTLHAAMIRPVILSGGGGTRLWPLSRSGNPKQLQRIVGEQSLLQATVQRCVGAGFGAPLISTGAGQRASVIDQLQAI